MPKLHQVFIGCPFATAIRRPCDKLKKQLEESTPLSVVVADTVGVSSSDYLLDHITDSSAILPAASLTLQVRIRMSLLRSV